MVNPAGRACLTDSVFAVMERSCWKGWFVPPRASQTVSTPPYREERLVTPPCREERLVTPPCREERLIRTCRSVSLHTIACRLHACSASCYTLVTRLLHARTECCCTLISRLVAHQSGKPSRQKPASQRVFAVIERAEEKNLSRSPLLNFSTGF